MEKIEKLKLSSDLIFGKILMAVSILFFAKGLYDVNLDTDFKIEWEIKIGLLICITGLIYFFVQPKVYYDESYLYITKFYKKETTIPLENVKSIFNNPLYTKTTMLSIEFIDNLKKENSIKFNAVQNSDKLSKFNSAVKKKNPLVEIV